MKTPRFLLNSVVAATAAVSPLVFPAASFALETSIVPSAPRTYRVLVLPFADANGVMSNGEMPPQQSWMTAPFLQQAFFGNSLAATGSGGVPLVSGSIADHWRRQIPGASLTGSVFTWPSGAANGFYQLSLTPSDIAGLDPEPRWFQSYRIMLNNIGYGSMPGRLTHAARLSDSPVMDAKLRNNVDGLAFISPGGGGAVRSIDGVRVSHAGLGALPDMNYNWIGIYAHEMGHLAWGFDDYYWPGREAWNIWNLMSAADGQFPGPLSPAVRVYENLPRVQNSLKRGRSEVVVLPAYRPLASPGSLPEILSLPDGTSSGGGNDDQMLVEYRQRDGSLPWDTSRGWLETGNTSGLFIQDCDTLWRGLFFSQDNTDGALSPLFGTPLSGPEWWERSHYIATNGISMRGADGDTWPQDQWLFGNGQSFLGSYADDLNLKRWRNSTNMDGNVIWEIKNPQRTGNSMSFEVQWQGVSAVQEAIATGTGTSVAGAMTNGTSFAAAGWFYRQQNPGGYAAGQTEALQIFSNRNPGVNNARVEWRHHVPEHGEVLSLSLAPEYTQGISGNATTVSLRVLNSAGGYDRQVTAVLPGSDPGGSFRPQVMEIDLTPWRGQCVRLEVLGNSGSPFGLSVFDAWGFRKADRILRDFAAEAPGASRVFASTAPGPEGTVGWGEDLLLEDNVKRARALVMVPPAVSRGRVIHTLANVAIPPLVPGQTGSSAILRGSVGYAASATGVSDGANVRITVDDGLHRFAVRNMPAPAVNRQPAYVALGGASGFQPVTEWGRGLGWSAPFNDNGWRGGDWLRTGDPDGDGDDDLIIFTGGDKPRVGVARSTRTGFAAPEVWHDFFCLDGERPFVGDFDGDGRDDIVTVTPSGAVYGALSFFDPFHSRFSFTGTGWLWASGVSTSNEVILTGDVNGDGRDDLIICTLETNPARSQGTVRVALGQTGGGLAAPVVWSTNGCYAGETPLVGKINSDTRADLISITPSGQGWAMASTGAAFGSPYMAVSSAPESPSGEPTVRHPQIYHGSRYTRGPVAYLTSVGGVSQLWWFLRNSYGGELQGDVMMATADASGLFSLPSRRHDFFGLHEEWPLTGDFNADGRADLLTVVPSFPEGTEARDKDEMVRSAKDPGDLYISPRPAGDMASRATANNPALRRPRLNRFETDLSSFAGSTISIELSVDAGPSAAGDYIIWPELKLQGPAGPPSDPAPQMEMRFLSSATLRFSWPASTCRYRFSTSTDLVNWFNFGSFAPIHAGSMDYFDLPVVPSWSREFYRLEHE